MNKTLRLTALLAALSSASLLHAQEDSGAIEFWHSNTAWAGQGQCAAEFTFDIGMMADPIENLQLNVALIDHTGRRVARGVLKVARLGGSNAERYATALLENAAVCDDKLTVLVEKATAREDNKRIDLIKTQRLSPRAFHPFPIRIGK